MFMKSLSSASVWKIKEQPLKANDKEMTATKNHKIFNISNKNNFIATTPHTSYVDVLVTVSIIDIPLKCPPFSPWTDGQSIAWYKYIYIYLFCTSICVTNLTAANDAFLWLEYNTINPNIGCVLKSLASKIKNK